MKKNLMSTLLLAILLCACSVWAAPVEQMIPYSKQLLTSPGTGSIKFTFSLWTDADITKGSQVWAEDKFIACSTATRAISTKLGDTATLNGVDFSQQLYIQMARKSDSLVLGARDKLIIAPYALWSANSAVLTWIGPFNVLATYAKHDAVSYLGSSYISTVDSNNHVPTDTGWDVLSVKGDMGATGQAGAAGTTGSQGIQGATGAQGIQGVVGNTGSTGAAGSNGANGSNGADGKTVLNGAGDPVTTVAGGVAGDFYLDTVANKIYGPKVAANWVGLNGVALVGPQGIQGATGPTGTTNASLITTGTLSVANGGTGQTGYAVGDLLYASTTTALSKLADVATGSALITGGVGVAPSWGTPVKTTNLVGGNSTTLLGSIGYQSNTDTTTLLGPNTTGTKKFLTMTGTGTNGAAPAWVTLVCPSPTDL